MDRENTMFTFVDQKTGEEVGCEYFDSITYNEKEYIVLLLKGKEEGELVIMHAEGDRKLAPIHDQETLTAVFGIFGMTIDELKAYTKEFMNSDIKTFSGENAAKKSPGGDNLKKTGSCYVNAEKLACLPEILPAWYADHHRDLPRGAGLRYCDPQSAGRL